MDYLTVRNSVLGLCMSLIFITGGIVGYMSISVGETSLKATRDMYEDGLYQTRTQNKINIDNCFAAGLENSRILAESLMEKVTGDMMSQANSYLTSRRRCSISLCIGSKSYRLAGDRTV